MNLWIAIGLIILPPLVIIWWIDIMVEDEFFDSFKPENRAAAESHCPDGINPPLDEEIVDVADNKSRCIHA